jgi:hypothetical protein
MYGLHAGIDVNGISTNQIGGDLVYHGGVSEYAGSAKSANRLPTESSSGRTQLPWSLGSAPEFTRVHAYSLTSSPEPWRLEKGKESGTPRHLNTSKLVGRADSLPFPTVQGLATGWQGRSNS